MIKNKLNYKKILFISLLILSLFSILFIYNSSKNTNIINKIQETPIPQATDVSKYILPINVVPLAETVNTSPDEIYGISRKNGSLVRYKDNSEIVVYSGKIKNYYIKEKIALIIDDNNLSEIVVLNLESNKQSKIRLDSISPITAVTISNDLKTIYFLAGFGIERKISTIYSIPINGGSYQKLNDTTAQSLEYLNINTLLLFQDDHAENKGVLYFFDLKQSKILSSKFTNSYKISPDGKYIALKTTKNIELVNAENLQSRSLKTPESNRFLWKDENTVVIFRNDISGINYAVLKINPFRISAFKLFVPESAMITAFGFIENKLIWENYKSEISSIFLDTN